MKGGLPISPDPSLFCVTWEVKNVHRKPYRTNIITEVPLKGKIRMESSDFIEIYYYIEIGIMRACVCVCVCSFAAVSFDA